LPDKDFHPARCIKIKLDALTPSCVESVAIPYKLLVITVMIDVGTELRSREFDFILTGY
jgi:hypothetical protein